VKKSQPVDRYIQILKLFATYNRQTGLGSTEVFRLIGRTDKQQFYDDIKVLVNAKILSSTKFNGIGHKQPKFLAELGKEIIEFVDDIEYYFVACQGFTADMFKYGRKWLENSAEITQEIDAAESSEINTNHSHTKYAWFNYALHMAGPSKAINNIVIRYAFMLTKLSIDNNSVAKDILTQMAIRDITSQFSRWVLLYKDQKDMIKDIEKWLSHTAFLVWQDFIFLIIESNLIDSPTIKVGFLNMVSTTLHFMKPNDKSIEIIIQGLNETLQSVENKKRKKRIEIAINLCQTLLYDKDFIKRTN
jgi:hypothetical protein